MIAYGRDIRLPERRAIDGWVSTHAHTVHHLSLAIGCALLVPALHRTAVPSPEGQCLIKDLALFGAALVIAKAGLRRERRNGAPGTA